MTSLNPTDMAPRAMVALFAGIGGMLPTLSRVGATFLNNPASPLPQYGICLGLLIFFVIGAVLAVAFGERSLRQALVIGISAPAIITSISTGVSEAGKAGDGTGRSPSGNEQLVDPETLAPIRSGAWHLPLVGRSYAQEPVPAPLAPAPRSSEAPFVPEQKITRQSLFGDRRFVLVIRMQNMESEGGSEAPPIQVQFFDEGGYSVGAILSAPTVSGHLVEATVPVSGRGFVVSFAQVTQVVRLPTDPFDQAQYAAQIKTKEGNDFLWALGFKRDVVEASELTVERLDVTGERPIAQIIRSTADQLVFGIDLSKFQEGPDWDRLIENQVRFAVMRATYGVKPDERVQQFWTSLQNAARRDQLAIGFYHFYRFGQAPEEQAEAFLAVTGDKTDTRMMPPTVVMAENSYDKPVANPADAEAYLKDLSSFVGLVEQALGQSVMIMLSQRMIDVVGLPAELASRPLWIKDFDNPVPRLPAGVTDYQLWQLGTAALPGIKGVVDLNLFNGDPTAFAAFVAAHSRRS